MSRIGKLPIGIPKGVTVSVEDHTVRVKGPKGELTRIVAQDIGVAVENDTIKVTRPSDESNHKALHGLTRTLIANMVEGVTKGYQKQLEISGVGYRAAVQGKKLQLQLGFSHDVSYPIPDGIGIVCEKPTMITVSGIDRQLVGQVAAEIRSFYPPEPYKGKGVRYLGEHVVRKEGKTVQ